jgi:hypothetical protein
MNEAIPFIDEVRSLAPEAFRVAREAGSLAAGVLALSREPKRLVGEGPELAWTPGRVDLDGTVANH